MMKKRNMPTPNWRDRPHKRWRWTTLRFESGTWCFAVNPLSRGKYIKWWEWDNDAD